MDKRAAQRLVARAIHMGDLVRSACEVCGNSRTDAHHEDYDQPLSVRWLCRKHHAQRHVERGDGRRRPMGDEAATATMMVRVTLEEHERFHAMAKRHGFEKLSPFIRHVLNEAACGMPAQGIGA